MNCDRYRRTLYLYRDGELSNREAADLVQHLHACESCRLEKERIAKAEDKVRRARSFDPVMNSSDFVASSIMSRVRSSIVEQSRVGMLDTILDLFALQKVRVASAAFVVLAVGTFLFQYLTLFTDIHSLESAANLESRTSHVSKTLYSVESTRLQELSHSKEFQGFVPSGQYTVADGQIVVHQSDVTWFLSSYGIRTLTSTVASSVLRMDKQKIDNIIEDVEKNAKIITSFGH